LAVAWMTNVGTSMCLRSLRKSVDENAVTQSRVPSGEAPAAAVQLSWMAWSLISLPRNWSRLKKSERNWERNAGRSAAIVQRTGLPPRDSGRVLQIFGQ